MEKGIILFDILRKIEKRRKVVIDINSILNMMVKEVNLRDERGIKVYGG